MNHKGAYLLLGLVLLGGGYGLWRFAREESNPLEAAGNLPGSPSDTVTTTTEPMADVPLATLGCTMPDSTERIVASWRGSPVPKDFSPVHGFQSLRFQFAGGEELGFRPEAAPSPGDWSCNIFSPGCRYVALLRSNSTGYDVVELTALRAYLTGQSPPLATLRYSGELPEPHYGHGRWVSPMEFEFFVSTLSQGDGWKETEKVRLRAKLEGVRPGANVPLEMIQEQLAQPPEDGCSAADARQ
ncbi:MAG TPA: hypothetical protein VF815_30105 [Myxococcaceae bacterium]|jgi:hypothetical protein